MSAGIKDILIIVGPDHSGQFLNLLGSIFAQYRVNISFVVQKIPRGLADAFILGEDFLDNDAVTMVLGDNIFEDDFTESIQSFESGGRIFALSVPDPERFGVVEFNKDKKVISIEEKPEKPKSKYAIPGIYIFDNKVCSIAKDVRPSQRGEIEITDVHNAYLKENELDVRILEGKWFDAGTFDSLLEASLFAQAKNLGKNFDPIVNEAIKEYNKEMKRIAKLLV